MALKMTIHTPTNPAFTPIPITEGVRPYAQLLEVLRTTS